jgi:hypothetical protein
MNGVELRRWPIVMMCAVGLLAAWVIRDLSVPVRASLRQFDAHAVGRLETEMWRSYYDHRRLRLFGEVAELLRTQYHQPFWRSNVGAWHAARAAVVFQRGHNRRDYELALPDLEAFYRLIRAGSDMPFDVHKAARLELEWWIVHRERGLAHPDELERALAALQAEIYREPAALFAAHAKARADAMLLRDARSKSGGVSEADWARISKLLDQSWTSLRTAVGSSTPQ